MCSNLKKAQKCVCVSSQGCKPSHCVSSPNSAHGRNCDRIWCFLVVFKHQCQLGMQKNNATINETIKQSRKQSVKQSVQTWKLEIKSAKYPPGCRYSGSIGSGEMPQLAAPDERQSCSAPIPSHSPRPSPCPPAASSLEWSR